MASEKEKKKSNLEFRDSLIASYIAFRDQIYNPESVLYPACNYEAGPSKTFKKTVFVDIQKNCIKELQEAGLNAINQDIRDYKTKDLHDLVILLSQEFHPECAVKHLKSNGYVIADNWHGAASWLNNRPKEFDLCAIIDYKDGRATITKNEDNKLAKTVSLESIKKSRSIEYDAFASRLQKGYDPGLPFERIADLYVFKKK